MSKVWPGWEYAKGVVNAVHIGSWLRLTKKAKRQGLQGRAKSDYGQVVRCDPPVSLLIRRDGLKTPDPYWAGHWRVPRQVSTPPTYGGHE